LSSSCLAGQGKREKNQGEEGDLHPPTFLGKKEKRRKATEFSTLPGVGEGGGQKSWRKIHRQAFPLPGGKKLRSRPRSCRQGKERTVRWRGGKRRERSRATFVRKPEKKKGGGKKGSRFTHRFLFTGREKKLETAVSYFMSKKEKKRKKKERAHRGFSAEGKRSITEGEGTVMMLLLVNAGRGGGKRCGWSISSEGGKLDWREKKEDKERGPLSSSPEREKKKKKKGTPRPLPAPSSVEGKSPKRQKRKKRSAQRDR